MSPNEISNKVVYYTIKESNTICTVGVTSTIVALTILATVLMVI
jgi:hypothetical protein